MTNSIVTNFNPKNLDSFKASVSKTADKNPGPLLMPILRFAKSNQWLLGKDKDVVEMGERLVIASPSMREGWIGWQNGQVVKEHLFPLGSPELDQLELSHIEPVTQMDGWFEQVMFIARFMDGPNPLQCQYKASTAGGRDAFYAVVRELSAQIESTERYLNPVVELSSESYRHKQYGTVYKPKFEVVDWMDYGSEALESKSDPTEELPLDPNMLL